MLSYTDVVLLSRKGRILTTLSPYIHLDLNAKLLVFAPAAQHDMGECAHTSFSAVLLQAFLFPVLLHFSTFCVQLKENKIERGPLSANLATFWYSVAAAPGPLLTVRSYSGTTTV